MRRILLSCSLLLLCSHLVQGTTAATQCGDVYPDAKIGPPPEWTFWADGSACFIRWAIASPSDEDKLRDRCRSTPGSRFVHFERTKGTGQSICIFKILDMATPVQSASSTPASENSERPLATPDTEPEVPAQQGLPSSVQGPDPDRLAATVGCSSIKLGNYKHCIGAPLSLGEGQFDFGLEKDCRESAIAAIAITDTKGRCVRRVTAIPSNGRSAVIESSAVPSVLDAIRFQAEVFECYARRHDNISCDGNTDYSDPLASSQIVINAAAETPAVRTPFTKNVKSNSKIRPAAKNHASRR